MTSKLTAAAIISIISLVTSHESAAHIAYLDLLQAENQTVNPDGSKTYSTVGAVKSNDAWANATDDNWGNSHTTPWYKFDITSPHGAFVNLTLARTAEVGIDVVDDFNPAFSLYKVLLPLSAHDGATEIEGKEGMWQAFADTTLANDFGEIGTIQYLAHAGVVGGQLEEVSIIHFFLNPGTYSIALGGSCYECYPHYEKLDPSNDQYDPQYENHIIDIENDAEQMRGYELGLTLKTGTSTSSNLVDGIGFIGLIQP